MPKPAAHESLSGYIGRFMGDKHDEEKWPKKKQRAAVAISEYREAKKKKK